MNFYVGSLKIKLHDLVVVCATLNYLNYRNSETVSYIFLTNDSSSAFLGCARPGEYHQTNLGWFNWYFSPIRAPSGNMDSGRKKERECVRLNL